MGHHTLRHDLAWDRRVDWTPGASDWLPRSRALDCPYLCVSRQICAFFAPFVPQLSPSELCFHEQPPPAWPMPLSSLHQIELQLIMHALTGDDLFRFARCCKAIRAASRSAFAFKHARVELHVIGREVVPALVTRAVTALKSFFLRPVAPVIPAYVAAATAVVWAPAAVWAPDSARPRPMASTWCEVREEDVDALLRAAQRVSPLHELHLAGFLRGVRTSQWRRIFSHESVQQLRVLRLDCILVPRHRHAKPLETAKPLSAYPWLIDLICQTLPHLHTLLEVPETVHSRVLDSIVSVPNLTRLSFSCARGGASMDVWEPLSRCRKLLHLDCMRPAHGESDFAEFMNSAVTRQLQTLTLKFLKGCPFLGSSAVGFESLVSLTRLDLIQAADIDSVLLLVARIPQLELLVIETGDPTAQPSHSQNSFCPTPNVLLSLMNSLPMLHVTLRLATPEHRDQLQGVGLDDTRIIMYYV